MPNHARVLVVDDIDVNRQISAEQLQDWGLEVETVDSGASALRRLRDARAADAPFDLVILDYFMPDMDGEAVARAVREDADLAATPLLVLTSVDMPGDARRFRDIGVEGYLIKPARSVVLRHTVAEILSGSIAPPAAKKAPIVKIAPRRKEGAMNILLAEDNEVNQMVLKHMLPADNISIKITENGEKALAAYKATPDAFDIVLMDVSMPVMDGLEATRAIRQFEEENQLDRTPIICLTAHVLASDVNQSYDAGMDDFLSKPISQEKLEATIDRWLDGSDAALSA